MILAEPNERGSKIFITPKKIFPKQKKWIKFKKVSEKKTKDLIFFWRMLRESSLWCYLLSEWFKSLIRTNCKIK